MPNDPDPVPLLSQEVICVVGPTASGKSALSQKIALRYRGEIVSADSMQVYQGMDIGTSKTPVTERLVQHYGIDICDPSEPYSAALFQTYARECFKDIDGRGKRIILCGGTGFYIRAAIDAYDFPKGEQVDNPIRDHYTRYAEEHGAHALWEMLFDRDRESADLIHPNNIRRVVRAFELLEEGSRYADQKEKLQKLPQAIPALFIGLEVAPELLVKRINERVDAMIEAGLVSEVQSLLDKGFRSFITAPQAIGYKEIVEVIDGKTSLEEAIEQIKVCTHRYAKRQRTWFRGDSRIHWLNADSGDDDELLLASSQLIDKIEFQKD